MINNITLSQLAIQNQEDIMALNLEAISKKVVAVLSDENFDQMGIPSNGIYIRDLGLEIARGNIVDMKQYIIIGRKDILSNTVFDDLSQIPSTIVIPDPGGVQLEIVSSSNNDSDSGGTNPQSTGIRSVDIEYLDTAGAEQVETITMDGTNPVNTVATDIDKIQWMHGLTAGSAGVAVGNISLRSTDAATTYEYIMADGNQSLSGRFTIPTGKTGYVGGWQASGITKIIDVRLRATVDRMTRGLITTFTFQDALLLDDAASGHIPFPVPLKMPAGAQIKLSAQSNVAGGDAAGHFSVLLIDD